MDENWFNIAYGYYWHRIVLCRVNALQVLFANVMDQFSHCNYVEFSAHSCFWQVVFESFFLFFESSKDKQGGNIKMMCVRSYRASSNRPLDASVLPVADFSHVFRFYMLLHSMASCYIDSLCNHSPVVYLHPSSGPIRAQAPETFCWNHPFLWILGHRKIDRH